MAYKADERPDLEKDIVPDLTDLSVEADTFEGAGQASTSGGIPPALICPLTRVGASHAGHVYMLLFGTSLQWNRFGFQASKPSTALSS